MRALLLSLVLFVLPATAQAQELLTVGHVPIHAGRPAFATTGVETMPQMLIDEASLQEYRFTTFTLPPQIWSEMKACAAKQGYDVSKAGEAPPVMVVPAARTIRVHDMTVDSLVYAEDSTFSGEIWTTTVAYSLVRSKVIVIVQGYRQNVYVLRHEALHFIIYRAEGAVGHPARAFNPCDRDYN